MHSVVPVEEEKYRILSQILTSKHFTLAKAVLEADGKPVILKLYNKGLEGVYSFEKIDREFGIFQTLDSVSFLKPLKKVTEKGSQFLVFEDEDVYPLARPSKFPSPTEVCEIGMQLCLALADLHKQGILLNGVRFDSLLISRTTGSIIFSDLPDSSPVAQATSAFKAKSNWEFCALETLSPEHTNRVATALDYRSDLYTLGTLLFYVATARYPFIAQSIEDLSFDLVATPPPLAHYFNHRLPEALSHLINKLLQKNPTFRYQSTEGVFLDLKFMSESLANTDTIPDFIAGQYDINSVQRKLLSLSSRQKICADLASKFQQDLRPPFPYLISVLGEAGVGKSTFVLEMCNEVFEGPLFFSQGKCRAGAASKPYEPFSELIKNLLAHALKHLRGQALNSFLYALRDKMGDKLAILTSFVPQASILQSTANVPRLLNPLEKKDTFFQCITEFLSLFTGPDSFLAIFIDDLQWIDDASRELLTHLVTTETELRIVFIVAYREQEMENQKQTREWFLNFSRSFAERKVVRLERLTEIECEEFVTTTLGQSGLEIHDFSVFLHQKSLGNPLHLLQSILTTKMNGDLYIDRKTGLWRCMLSSFTLHHLPESIGRLLAQRIDFLDKTTQSILKFCACDGVEFSPLNVSEAMRIDIASVMTSVQLSEQQGFLIAHRGRFRFTHTLVWETVLKICPPHELDKIHLNFARYYCSFSNDLNDFVSTWDIAQRFYFAKDTDLTEQDRNNAIVTHGFAGRMAMDQGAFAQALQCFERGLLFFQAPLLPQHNEQSVNFELLRIECLFLTETEAVTAQDINLLIENTQGTDRIRALKLVVEFYLIKGDLNKAVDLGLEGLAVAGVPLPKFPTRNEVDEQYKELCRLQNNVRQNAELSNMPLSFASLEKSKGILDLISALIPSSVLVSRQLTYLLSICASQLEIKQGNLESVYSGIPELSLYLLDAQDNPQEAWSNLINCYNKMEQQGLKNQKALICNLLGGIVCHWIFPYRKALPFLVEGMTSVNRSSDLIQMTYCAINRVTVLFYAGENLETVLEECKRTKSLLIQKGVPSGYCDLLTGIELACECLSGKTYSLFTYEKDGFEHDEFLKNNVQNPARKGKLSPQWYFVPKMLVSLVRGSYEEVAECEKQVRELMTVMHWFAHGLELSFHVALSIAMRFSSARTTGFAQCDTKNNSTQYIDEEHITQLNTLKNKISTLTLQSPENCKAKELLLLGILALEDEDFNKGETLLDSAIEAAQGANQTHYEALGNEWAAYHYIRKNKPEIAELYMKKSIDKYTTWGAHAKAEQLGSQYECLFEDMRFPFPPAARGHNSDLVALIQSSQTLSSQTTLADVAQTFLKITSLHSGADRALLFFAEEDGDPKLFLEVAQNQMMEAWEECQKTYPLSIVKSVAASQKVFLRHTPDSSGDEAEDPYFLTQIIPSLVCLPIVRNQKTLGILFLENHVSYGVFTHRTLENLNVLVGQAAISIENARLYERQQKIQTELTLARDAAEQASRTKSEFLACLSHEIRTPLNAILGFNELMQLPTFSSVERNSFLKKIHANCSYLLNLINDLLDLSRIERGEIRIEEDVCSPVGVLRDVLSDFQKETNSKGLSVRVINSEGVPRRLTTDPFRLRQILQNLIGNAVKFTDSGFIDITLGFHMAERPNLKHQLEISVQDSGRGIEANQRDRIFEPFAQAHTFLERKHRGMGIGLDVSRRIARILGGDVVLQKTHLGKGSVFLIQLPVSIPQESTFRLPRKNTLSQSKALQGMTFLVADDAPDNCLLVTRILELAGAKVSAVSDGGAAVSQATKCSFDAIILDIQMPILNGFEAAREIRKIPFSPPLIALSAHVRPEEETRSLQEGFDAHLCKPIRAATLIHKVQDLVTANRAKNSI